MDMHQAPSATRYIKPKLSFALFNSPTKGTYLLYPTVPVANEVQQNRMIGELRAVLQQQAAGVVADEDYTLRVVASKDRLAPWMIELGVTSSSTDKSRALATAIDTLFAEKTLTR